MIRFLVSFQQEFKIMEPITNKRHIKLNEWKKKFELIFRGSRLIYVSFIIISAGILNEVIAETEPGETGTVLFILFASITSVYVPESLMLLYRYAEKIHRKRILWIAYGFYGAYVTALLLPLLRFILKMGGHNLSGIKPISFALGALILVVSIAISLFATDVFDVQLIIRKTVTYGVLSLILVFLFAVLEEWVVSYLGNYFDFSIRYNSIVTAGILAVSGTILKKAIEPSINKYLKVWMPD